ncbi:MAG TPA: hypothetical protein VD862_02840 [Candidatus Paceibacterota bacterium]|nr:hypothetical protein [Candidatus Paceibacterota bacterium]
MPRKKASKKMARRVRGVRKTDEQVILDFLAGAITALREEKVHVKEIEKRESVEGDHSFSVTEGYRFPFRGVNVFVGAKSREVALDGVYLGEEILKSQVLNAISDCYTLLRGDCAERVIMQHADDEMARRARQEQSDRELRTKGYRRIADKLRSVRAGGPRVQKK